MDKYTTAALLSILICVIVIGYDLYFILTLNGRVPSKAEGIPVLISLPAAFIGLIVFPMLILWIKKLTAPLREKSRAKKRERYIEENVTEFSYNDVYFGRMIMGRDRKNGRVYLLYGNRLEYNLGETYIDDVRADLPDDETAFENFSRDLCGFRDDGYYIVNEFAEEAAKAYNEMNRYLGRGRTVNAEYAAEYLKIDRMLYKAEKDGKRTITLRGHLDVSKRIKNEVTDVIFDAETNEIIGHRWYPDKERVDNGI